MQKRIKWTGIIVLAMTAMGWVSIAGAAETTGDNSKGDAALAERYAQMAGSLLQSKTVLASSWRMSGALLEAAHQLKPDDPRYLRLLVEAALRAGDRDEALKALNDLRRLQPDNRQAQIQSIDIYVGRMESADAKVKYLSELVGKNAIADEVRAHAATLCAQVLLEQSKRDQAQGMLNQAVRLNPLDLTARRMQMNLLGPTALPYERVALLLAMLRSNPAQSYVTGELARGLGAAGMVEQSLTWYGISFQLAQRTGTMSADLIRGYASELLVANQAPSAATLISQLLSANPGDSGGWFLWLLINKTSGKKEDYDRARQQAMIALTNNFAMVRKQLGESTATTRPIDSADKVEFPDVSRDAELFKKPGMEKYRDAYVAASSDVAWLQLYFNDNWRDAEKLTNVLRSILPEGNETVARLEGWIYLLQGKSQEAGVKLSAVADRDPLSGLGLARLAPEASKKAQESKLLGANCSGVVGAFMAEAFRGQGVQVQPASYAAAIQDTLDKFPKDWLTILDKPQNFYAIRVKPLQIAVTFGKPMLVEVVIQNLSDLDLTIGSEGVLHPDLWFDAQLHGVMQQAIPGVCYDRIGQQVVLRARQRISQVIRIDQGDLARLFEANPGISFQVQGTVLTNPVPTQQGLMPGAAGYQVRFDKFMERVGQPVNMPESRTRIYMTLATGDAAEKIQNLELLARYSQQFQGAESNDQMKQLAIEFIAMIRRNNTDPLPVVRAWANYLLATIAAPEARANIVRSMLKSADWQERLLALVSLQSLSLPVQKGIADSVANTDENGLVKTYASSLIEYATQAATQPTTAPAK